MKLKPGALWPAVIAGALGLHVVGSMVMVYFATSNESYAVEPDYYQKALHWSDKQAQDRVNAELGWQLKYTVEPAQPGQDPTLSVTLTSTEGDPVTGATVAVETFANARRNDILTSTVSPSESGYETTMPMRRDGLWEFRFTVTRGDDLFTFRDMRHIWTEIPK